MTDADLLRRIQRLEDRLNRHEKNFNGLIRTFTPTWTTASDPQPAIGDGTLTGQYIVRYGGLCLAQFYFLAGASTTFGNGAFRFALPVAVSSLASLALGVAILYDATGNRYTRIPLLTASGTYIAAFIDNNSTATNLTATVPFTWASGDYLRMQIEYRT